MHDTGKGGALLYRITRPRKSRTIAAKRLPHPGKMIGRASPGRPPSLGQAQYGGSPGGKEHV